MQIIARSILLLAVLVAIPWLIHAGEPHLQPVHVDPKRTPSDLTSSDRFGEAASIDGGTAIIGAAGKDKQRGAAYIWEQHLGGANRWGQRIRLAAPDLTEEDFYGYGVSIDRDTAIVGAGVQRGKREREGAVYIYERHLGGEHQWGQRKKLKLPDPQPNDFFGLSVSLSGDTLAIGAPGENPYANDEGAAYIYERNLGGPNQWGQRKRIITQAVGKFGELGTSLSLDGNTLLIGSSLDRGRAFIFERDLEGADNWGQRTMLTPADSPQSDGFGLSVALDHDTAVVGAPNKNEHTGAVYVYRRNVGGPNHWGQIAMLTAKDGVPKDHFGQSVAIHEGLIVVGAPGMGNKDQTAAGTAFVFQEIGNKWTEVARLAPTKPRDKEAFGRAVAVGQGFTIVGSLNDEGGEKAGAAYFFLMLEQLELLEGVTWNDPSARSGQQ